MNIMRDAENCDFQLYAYLKSVRWMDMHIVEQSRTKETVIAVTKNEGLNNLDKKCKKTIERPLIFYIPFQNYYFSS